MARKKRNNDNVGINSEYHRLALKGKKPINTDHLLDVEALTPNQQRLFDSYQKGKHVIAYGTAGTGKTYTGVALAVKALKQKQDKQ